MEIFPAPGAQGPARRRGSRALPRPARPERAADVTGEIEWAKVTQTVPADYPAVVAKSVREAPRDPAEIGQIYGMYEQLKRDRSVIDFEDVLLLTVGILQDRHDIADQIRSQYHHFVVDEYQDVSRSSSAFSTSGSATATASASSATPARRSTPSPAPPPTTC